MVQRTLLAALLACSACSGGDDGDDDDSDKPKAGTSASGTGGRGGSTAVSGTGAPPVEPVPCGSSECTPPMSLLSALPIAIPGLPTSVACCVDEDKGTCGAASAEGATCEPPATPDERCPGVNLAALGAIAGGMAGGMLGQQMMGCCTPSGACGLDGAIFGRGCVENGEARAQIGSLPLVGMLIPIPESRACDAAPTDDAGTADDAGI